jgi:hypothetical protein
MVADCTFGRLWWVSRSSSRSRVRRLWRVGGAMLEGNTLFRLCLERYERPGTVGHQPRSIT